jgi:transposase
MATDTVTVYLMHPHRSQEAFCELIEAWQGLLVSDGYGVYQKWVNRRQTCWAHRSRTARGLSEKRDAELAAWEAWALAELQRLCHMAQAPPSGGAGKAW